MHERWKRWLQGKHGKSSPASNGVRQIMQFSPMKSSSPTFGKSAIALAAALALEIASAG
jgi:hypothetical protein